jgi:hypothetical protein
MIRHLRKDAAMSTYAARNYNFSTAKDAWRWPLVITLAMLLISFIPALGLVNLLLFVPVSFILCVNMFRNRHKMGRVFLGFLILFAACIIPLVLNSALAV